MAILGIDEVGRGPWAGPLVIGAVILPRETTGDYPDWVADLTDSKKLTDKKRQILSKNIYEHALATGLGWVSSSELDQIGLSEALHLAARRALSEVLLSGANFSEIIIDGTMNFLSETSYSSRVTTLKKADLLIKEVSAASIIAKLARDNYMKSLAKLYPAYAFEKHVGYGTALHKATLEQFGPCPEHRFSFKPIKTLLECHPEFKSGVYLSEVSASTSLKSTTKEIGDHAESVVVDFLEHGGHQIVARNYKTPFYEIDIISIKDKTIYFTEVKYRRSDARGASLDAITKDKLSQMTFAAESFLHYSPFLTQKFSPLLAVASVSGVNFVLNDWFPIVS